MPDREEVRPAREVVDRRPEPAHRGDRACDGRVGLERDPVVVGIDEVAGRSRLTGIELGAREPEWLQHAEPKLIPVRAAAMPRDDLAEQAEREVRVVPGFARTQDALGVLEPGQKLLPRRRLHRLPHLAGRLALQAAQVRERVADSRAGRHLGDVRAERIVEVEDVRVAQPEDADRRERLRDRPDPIGVLRRRGLVTLDVRRPDRGAPEHRAVAEHRGRDRRRALLGLGGRDEPVEPASELLRQRHAFRARGAPARSRDRSPRRRRRDA